MHRIYPCANVINYILISNSTIKLYLIIVYDGVLHHSSATVFGKGVEGVDADYHVVEERDVDWFEGGFETLCLPDVGFARGRRGAGVIMDNYHRGGLFFNHFSHHEFRVDDCRTLAAAGHPFHT